jgi:hypothetical protein
MTGKAIDYSKTSVSFYKFVCNDAKISSCYVGHTTNFTERKAGHKRRCYNENSKKYNFQIYQIIRANGGFENWRMIEIETRIVKDKREAERIEQDYMEQFQSDLNKQKSHSGFETLKEYHINYRQENRDEINSRQKEYYQNNKNKVAIYQQKYRQENKTKIALEYKEKIICECGCSIGKYDLSRHKKSQKHKDLMETKTGIN